VLRSAATLRLIGQFADDDVAGWTSAMRSSPKGSDLRWNVERECNAADACTSRKTFADCYLVDPASSHMLVSKIKPCIVSVLALTRRNREWLIKSVMVH
jgi:hypothetical protein